MRVNLPKILGVKGETSLVASPSNLIIYITRHVNSQGEGHVHAMTSFDRTANCKNVFFRITDCCFPRESTMPVFRKCSTVKPISNFQAISFSFPADGFNNQRVIDISN